MPLVYLAGPISGQTKSQSEAWREKAAGFLQGWGINTASPMRGKEYFATEQILEGSYEEHPMSTEKAIMIRDSFDCRNATAILINLLECGSRVSIGTVMEIAFAYENKVPVVLAMQKDNIHNHPMINQAVYARLDTIEEALNVMVYLVRPYIGT